jgi:hypothetical protein
VSVERPSFQSAIPKKRYQVGEFTVVVLGDIENIDNGKYVYVLAVVKEGAKLPTLYVTLEDNDMTVIGENINEKLGSDPKWRDQTLFTASAMNVAIEVLGLRDEMPVPLS